MKGRKRKRNHKKGNAKSEQFMSAVIKLGLVVVAGVLVLLGVGMLQDTGLLTTRILWGSPSPSPTSGGRDWESFGALRPSKDLLEETEICPSPSPTSTTTTSPLSARSPSKVVSKVLGVGAPVITTICRRGFVGEGPNPYKFPNPIPRIVEEEDVDGLDPGYIMAAVCKGNPAPSGCSGSSSGYSRGCTKLEFTEGSPDITLVGLYEWIDELVEFVDGKVYPTKKDLKNGTNGVWTRAVYPLAPDGDEEIPVRLWMSMWQLSLEDEQTLREWYPGLLNVAEAAMAYTRNHEEGHWRIMSGYIPLYLGLINGPPIPPLSYANVRTAGNRIADMFFEAWNDLRDAEHRQHKLFHDREGRRDLGIAPIPLDGMDHIDCVGIREDTHDLEVGVVGATGGRVDAKLVAASNATRDMSCNTQCKKTYFDGAEVKIDAVADDGYELGGWVPDPTCPCGGESCTVTMSQSRSCVAYFED